MDIRIVDFVAGAREARGLAVIIDVFRAFSLAAYATAWGAARIWPVDTIEAALALKRAHPDAILLGERYARPLPGFDGGNSPSDLERLDLRGRTLIHTTHAGTQGLVNAKLAEEVITGALVNAGAVVEYIRRRAPAELTLVRMGQHARERCEEDDACAELIVRRLRGESPDTVVIRERLRGAPSAAKFFDPACDWAPERDFELCTRVDAFDFVLRLDRDASPPALVPIPIKR
ncbi:MAG TPA: 2-phosphosulfolactate phosphatase [Steroidobacteraceae bacterium]